jgi:hypothetical protein
MKESDNYMILLLGLVLGCLVPFAINSKKDNFPAKSLMYLLLSLFLLFILRLNFEGLIRGWILLFNSEWGRASNQVLLESLGELLLQRFLLAKTILF